jgi:hypothetical protein
LFASDWHWHTLRQNGQKWAVLFTGSSNHRRQQMTSDSTGLKILEPTEMASVSLAEKVQLLLSLVVTIGKWKWFLLAPATVAFWSWIIPHCAMFVLNKHFLIWIIYNDFCFVIQKLTDKMIHRHSIIHSTIKNTLFFQNIYTIFIKTRFCAIRYILLRLRKLL